MKFFVWMTIFYFKASISASQIFVIRHGRKYCKDQFYQGVSVFKSGVSGYTKRQFIASTIYFCSSNDYNLSAMLRRDIEENFQNRQNSALRGKSGTADRRFYLDFVSEYSFPLFSALRPVSSRLPVLNRQKMGFQIRFEYCKSSSRRIPKAWTAT